ncbi:serine hydrolase [Pedobacter cryoconitis]|uniref:CubicO group peptidase (Beta-lactamase class C family) n=1 Tax=Pedobacter cryoconitis TaxID=188932 RepID=A0A7X0J6D7_9SPHI|nr:serine hydrolase [Pedobacter cryoconitis]MBB6501758.1 CubicO group peptidase (beta-lactamase class C family) [Pedobacter cryoconitis]
MLITLLTIVLIGSSSAYGQENKSSSLYQIIKNRDSLLFSVGFNTCSLPQFENLLSDDFEFYHDQAGITLSKEAFVNSMKNNVCGLNYKARRVLEDGSMEVYPLKKNGIIYGAIQTGIHRFYALEPGKPEYFTSRAKFTHVWNLLNGEWKLLRGLSYDHQETEFSPPVFEDPIKMNAWLKENNVPALAIGLIRDGNLQEIKIYGELDKGKPVSYNSIFNVASLTKMVTTMLTLKLASKGKWNLDEPLYKYWTDPDIKADPRSKKITTLNILTQKSGFPNWRRELSTGKLAFQFEPGTKYQYSGEGFEYLRHALESKFHKSLDQLADEIIFKPLGMTDSHYIWDSHMDESRFAIPHDSKGNALPIEKNTTASGADQLKTTIADYGKFLIAAINGEGLSKKIAEQMVSHQTKTKDNRYIGLGWFIYDQLGDGEYAISHGGDDPGAHSIFFLLPKSGNGVIIFTNSDNGPKLYADILKNYLKDKGKAIIDIEMK